MEISYCPICGYGPFKDPYHSTDELRQSFEICDCCGCEYGNDDTQEYLSNWEKLGCNWFNKKAKPENWSLQQQITHIIRPWPPSNT